MRWLAARPLRLRFVLPLAVAIMLMLGALASVATADTAPGYSPRFFVGGRVEHRKVYTLADLKKLPAHDVTVSFIGPTGTQTHNYRGALLLDVANAASPKFDPDQKNDRLRWSARVHATDDYEVIVAWGEFDPGFENKQILLAYAENGQPLTTDGMARLVVPGDSHGGRYVSNVNAVSFDPPRRAEGWFGFPWHWHDD